MVPLLMSDYEGRHSGTSCTASENLFASNADPMKDVFRAATTDGRRDCGSGLNLRRDRMLYMIAAKVVSKSGLPER